MSIYDSARRRHGLKPGALLATLWLVPAACIGALILPKKSSGLKKFRPSFFPFFDGSQFILPPFTPRLPAGKLHCRQLLNS
jgi:hypothetical protein